MSNLELSGNRRAFIAAALTAVTGWEYFSKSLPYLREDAK